MRQSRWSVWRTHDPRRLLQHRQPDLALIALADIIAVSDRNNRRDQLTGALLVSRGRFFQILEGEPVDVDRALRRIAADPRHHDLLVVSRHEVASRLFPGWSMVAARVTPAHRTRDRQRH